MAKPDPNRLRIARSSFLGTPPFLTRGGSSRLFVRLPAIFQLTPSNDLFWVVYVWLN